MEQWYLDSGCSKHMIGDKSKFLSISFKQEGHVTYGDNNKGRILGRGSIGDKDILIIHDVLYVEGLKHNLLSISQLCDKGYQVIFKTNSCEIYLPNTQELARRLQNTKNNNIGSIRSDLGGEFQNQKFNKFCEKMRILHNFSAPRNPQQNGLVERKIRSLEELARIMLSESSLPKYFWVDAVNTSCYVMNRVLIRPNPEENSL